MKLSREFTAIVACCRSNAADRGLLFDKAERFDWALFLRLAQFHRVQGLVWKAVGSNAGSLPEEIASQLADDARAIASDNLRLAVECGRLQEAFAAGQIPLLFVKGLPLAVLAHGGIAEKAGIDIDLLVPADALRQSAILLNDLGYCALGPGAEDIDRWHLAGKESCWIHVTERHLVDLHSRLSDHRALIPSIGIDSPRQMVAVAPHITLPTLELDALFAYLCVHGASSAWFRLKWIVDLAALLDRLGLAEVEPLYRASQQIGAGRTAGQALLLAHALFGTLTEAPALQRELIADRLTRWLFKAAIKQLAGAREPVEPTSRKLGTAIIHLTQLALVRDWRFPLSEAVRQVRAAVR